VSYLWGFACWYCSRMGGDNFSVGTLPKTFAWRPPTRSTWNWKPFAQKFHVFKFQFKFESCQRH
jgi:hypothetical protein